MKNFLVCFFAIITFCQIDLTAQEEQTVGLFLNTEESFPGYTLFTGRSRDAYLIDNCGKLVNHWEASSPIGLSNYIHTDGNLYRCVRSGEQAGFNAGGIGGAVEILNWEGDQLWYYDFAEQESYHSHHDLEVLPNGNILVLAWEWRSIAEADSMGRINPQTLWPTLIFEVEPLDSSEANFVWEWRLWDHIIQDIDSLRPNFGIVSQHPELFNINEIGFSFSAMGSDWIHCNTVEYIPEFDQIVLSAKHISEVWVIDHSTTTEEAAGHDGGTYNKGGDFLYRWGNSNNYNIAGDMILNQQHDVSWIPLDHPTDGGKFMVFNNGQAGRIDLWTPPINADGSYTMNPNMATEPLTPDWSYNSDADSPIGCSSRRLPNGNTLYADNSGAIMKEINSDEELVWHYISPVNVAGPVEQGYPTTNAAGQNTHTTFRAERYPIDYEGFIGKDMTPGEPIELEPWEYDCITDTTSNDTTTAISYGDLESNIVAYPMPASDYIFIDSDLNIESYRIYDTRFKIVKASNFERKLSIGDLASGVYFLELFHSEKRNIITFIKE